MTRRKNINFDQILNEVRKNERDFILKLLTQRKEELVSERDFQRATVVREMIALIEDSVGGSDRIPSTLDGTRERNT